MKKISILLTTLTLLFLSSVPAFANPDADVTERNVGGTDVSYSHWLTYMDTRCGVNTQSHYYAIADNNINEMNLSWQAYDVLTGNVADSNSFGYTNQSTIRDDSEPYLAIEQSQANYEFSESGSFWNPTSNIYHCTGFSSNSLANNINKKDEEIINGLRDLYEQNKQVETYNQQQNKVNKVKNIVKPLFEEEHKETLNEYTFENGEKISFEDFDVQKVSGENNKNLNANGVKASNPEENNSTIIELEIPDKVYKNENAYKLTGYVIFVDDKDEKIDYGISGELIDN